jgi:signal recognition particle receptor subunit alpha
LRDAMEAKKQSRPYVMTFCGVNGVGKSTNLAKVNRIFYCSLHGEFC